MTRAEKVNNFLTRFMSIFRLNVIPQKEVTKVNLCYKSDKTTGDYLFESMCFYHHKILDKNQRTKMHLSNKRLYISGKITQRDYFEYLHRVVFAKPPTEGSYREKI